MPESASGPRRISLGGPGLRVVAPESENAADARRRANEDNYRNRLVNFVLWMHKSVEDIASHLERMVTAVYEGQIHGYFHFKIRLVVIFNFHKLYLFVFIEMCPHNQSCFDYWMEVLKNDNT